MWYVSCNYEIAVFGFSFYWSSFCAYHSVRCRLEYGCPFILFSLLNHKSISNDLYDTTCMIHNRFQIFITFTLWKDSSWRVISPHFPQKVWPSKHVTICKRTEIHSISYPKFGGIGPWDQADRPISGYISTHQLHASHFQFMVPTTKLIRKLWNLPKCLGGMGTQTPVKRVNVTLIHSKFFIDEVLQCLVDKYQITYQNIWGKAWSGLI